MLAAQQGKIEYGMLELSCALAVQSILDFRIVEAPGEHGRGIFHVRLEPGAETASILSDLRDTPVELRAPESGLPGSGALFSGYLDKVQVSVAGGSMEAEFTVITGSVRLDRTVRKRAYQDPEQTYEDVVTQVLQNIQDSTYILTVPEKETAGPLYQYQETDWQFLKRVASSLGLPLVADSSYHRSRFYIGMPQGLLQELPEDSEVSLCFEGERFYRLQGKGVGVVRKDFLCNRLTTLKNLNLGDRLILDGREVVVSRKEVVLEKGSVMFYYTLAGKSYNNVALQLNTDMIGLEIAGHVKKSEGEQCQVALDGERSQGEGFQYPYAPMTGNFMYCMPQDGSKVYLKLGNGEVKEGLVSVCLQTYNGSSQETKTPSQRGFYTEASKSLELYPDSLTLTGVETGSISLTDNTGLILTSAKGLILCAQGGIRLESEGIVALEAASGVFAEVWQAATSTLGISGRFDYLSSNVLLRGTEYIAYEPFDDAPKKGKFDWLGWTTNLVKGLAIAVGFLMVASTIVVTGGASLVAYAALQGAACGALIATAAISIQDLSSGNVRSEEEAEQTICVAAISGALTAAVAVGINYLLGLKFFALHTKLAWGLWIFGNGSADIVAGMLTRASDASMLEGMTEEERNAYIFSPAGILFDFTLGRVLDFVIGRPSIPSANSASRQALGEVAEEGAEQIVKEIEGEVTEQVIKDVEGEVAEQAAKEVEGEVAEQIAKEAEGETIEQATKDAIESGSKTIPSHIETRLDELVDEIRKDIGKDYPVGNVGAAITDIEGVSGEIKAYSKYNNSISDTNLNHEYSYNFGENNRIFDTQPVNSDNIINGPGAYDRAVDSESKILEDIAHQLGYNQFCVDETVTGSVYLLTERPPCPSCEGVIEQFKKMFPNLNVYIINKY